jgi:hypothetical protein
LVIYLYGFWLVFLQSVLVAVLMMWALQVFAMALEARADWGPVLLHLILTVYFAALFPGQTFWTFRLTAADGTVYTIIGDPELDRPGA